MGDLISNIFGDTLWIYTSILGALIGAAFLAYFKDTRMGLWAYDKLDQFLDDLFIRYGWTWLEQPEDSWRKRYPKITKKIDELDNRIKELENAQKMGDRETKGKNNS
jgi:hypothetical protein